MGGAAQHPEVAAGGCPRLGARGGRGRRENGGGPGAPGLAPPDPAPRPRALPAGERPAVMGKGAVVAVETGLPLFSAPRTEDGALRGRVGTEGSGAVSAPSGQCQPWKSCAGGDGELCGAGDVFGLYSGVLATPEGGKGAGRDAASQGAQSPPLGVHLREGLSGEGAASPCTTEGKA